MKINPEIIEKAAEYASDLNHCDAEELTPPTCLDALWGNQEFEGWLNELLSHCARIAIGYMEDESPEEIELREPLKWFAAQMEETLRRNDHKTGWHDCNNGWLLSRLREETEELKGALGYYCAECKTHHAPKSPETIIREATDIANFAMMIADNVRRNHIE